MKRVGIFLLAGLVAVTAWVGTVAAEDAFEVVSELQCGSARIKLVKECFGFQFKAWLSVSKQYLVFTDLKTGRVVTHDITGEMELCEDPSTGLMRECSYHYTGAWICLIGKDCNCVRVNFFNTGNCDTCEWHEVYSEGGEFITTDHMRKHDSFNQTLDRLGIDPQWHSDSVIRIPCHYSDFKKSGKE